MTAASQLALDAPPSRWSLALYSAAHLATLPFLLPLFGLHPRLRGQLGQRWGAWPCSVGGPVWLHGASAGDLVALLPLGQRLGAAGLPVLYSAWTRSGEELARGRLGERAVICRAPLDLAGPVRRALERTRPRLLVLECLEMWPHLVSACQQRGIPVVVVNGRLSAKSLRRYQRLPGLFAPCFRSLRWVSALSEGDARRFIAAGVPEERIVVRSSSKHAAGLVAMPSPSSGLKLVLGSMHAAEEKVLFPALSALMQALPELRVVVAPRYPHRARQVRRHLAHCGLQAELLSEAPAARLLVVDRLGQLAEQYLGAAVAFVGGSLVPRGGHNLVEAAARGAVVVTGPHIEHCQHEAAALQLAGAAVMIRDGREFYARAFALLSDAAERTARRARASRVVQELRCAAEKIAAKLLELAACEDVSRHAE